MRYFLSGIDFFQVLVDHHIRRKKGPGHVTRLAIFLEGRLERERLERAVAENDLCRRIARLRLHSHGGLGYSYVAETKKPGCLPVSFHEADSATIPAGCLNAPLDFHQRPPVGIQVFFFNNPARTCLLFSFHHTVFDHAGVQAFIRSLNGERGVALFPGRPFHTPVPRRFQAFFKAIGFAFTQGNTKMTEFGRPLPAGQKAIVFKEVVFSKEETRAAAANSARYGAGHNKSAFLLAAVCKALHDNIFSRQQKHGFIWTPVPVNFRKKGGQDAALLNGLSFLFYKLRIQDLATLTSTVDAIQLQMRDQVRRRLPHAFVEFVNGYRFVPLPIYYPMFNLPSLGKLSTFSFSSLGDSFHGLDEFLGLPVADIQNFPSNLIVPGLTVIFYEFRGHLRLMSSWVDGWFSEAEQAAILGYIKSLVVGD
ncbi:MAG: hypothetical protein H6577_05690 [Lewinellaceae bacterium]|nr:hypothetical protein [Saprospiraceae bacterium]MCB9337598.1 hypothetical protein [Lewinellaceae bacterium]